MTTLKNTRFNFLLTADQKRWLLKKAGSFTSCGHIIRSLIQEAMDKDTADDKTT
jgi:hypothetical protein